jgi:hypothetical protein
MSRREVIDMLMRLSNVIADFERGQPDLLAIQAKLDYLAEVITSLRRRLPSEQKISAEFWPIRDEAAAILATSG